MKNIRQNFKHLSPVKKVLYFNAYAIVFASIFLVVSFFINPLFNDLFDGKPYMESIMENLNSVSFYAVEVVWGYFMTAFTLFSIPNLQNLRNKSLDIKY